MSVSVQNIAGLFLYLADCAVSQHVPLNPPNKPGLIVFVHQ